MEYYGSQINKLIEELSRLPGIGAKSAQRLAFHIIGMPREQVDSLSSAIVNAKTNVRYCSCCCTLTDEELCPICSNPSRNHRVIMVVENTRDMAAYEKTQKYDGVYHVLHGAISPMLGRICVTPGKTTKAASSPSFETSRKIRFAWMTARFITSTTAGSIPATFCRTSGIPSGFMA